MFELPIGKPVNETLSFEEGVLQPFAHGVISTYAGRRKTPQGHRLVVLAGWWATSAMRMRRA